MMTTGQNLSILALTLMATACGSLEDPQLNAIEGVGDHNPEGKIINGDSPDAWWHDAVVSLHERSGNNSMVRRSAPEHSSPGTGSSPLVTV